LGLGVDLIKEATSLLSSSFYCNQPGFNYAILLALQELYNTSSFVQKEQDGITTFEIRVDSELIRQLQNARCCEKQDDMDTYSRIIGDALNWLSTQEGSKNAKNGKSNQVKQESLNEASFTQQQKEVRCKIKHEESRKLRVALLARPGQGKSFIFNFLVAGEASVRGSNGKVDSVGPSPSFKKAGGGLTFLPIWVEHDDIPSIQLMNADSTVREIGLLGLPLDPCGATLEYMESQIRTWNTQEKVFLKSRNDSAPYILVRWPSEWIKRCNISLIDVSFSSSGYLF